MANRGHEVTVITGMPNYPHGKFFGDFRLFRKQSIGKVCLFRVPLLPRGKSRGWELSLNYVSFFISALIFGPFLLRGRKFDVVFSVNYSPATVGLLGVYFSKLKKAKSLVWIQDLWPQSLSAVGAIKSKLVLAIVGKMVGCIYKNTDLILVQSQGFILGVIEFNIPKSKIRFFPNWAEDFYNAKAKTVRPEIHVAIPKDKFIIMFAGNLGYGQGLNTITQAACILKNEPVHWVIVGDGRAKVAFEDSVEKLELSSNFSFLGSYPREMMPEFFTMADVMLVALKDDEAFLNTIPSKIQAYLKSGKPILSSLNGEGAAVIIDSQAGLNVSAENYAGLASAALKLSEMESHELKKMGQSGLKYYNDNFDLQMLLLMFESWANELIKLDGD